MEGPGVQGIKLWALLFCVGTYCGVATSRVAVYGGGEEEGGDGWVKGGIRVPRAAAAAAPCSLLSTDPDMPGKITALENSGAKLLEFNIAFSDYESNPLLSPDMRRIFRGYKWTKALTKHGRTLLSLPFNYDVLSVTMLSFGVEQVKVELMDSPIGCFGNLSAEVKERKMTESVLANFDTVSDLHLKAGWSCHQRIVDANGVANFQHECCKGDRNGEDGLYCTNDISVRWISIISVYITFIKIALFLAGPLLLTYWTYGESPYVVKLKRPIMNSIRATKRKLNEALNPRGAELETLPVFSEAVNTLNQEEKTCVEFHKLQIEVDHRRLMNQKSVPVGLFRFLFDNLVWCGLRRWEPFFSCCKGSFLGTWGPKFLCITLCRKADYHNDYTWEKLFNLIGGILLLLIIPLPYYIRCVIYYIYEDAEVVARKNAVTNLGLDYPWDNSAILYFGPGHGFMVFIYVMYVVSFLSVVLLRGFYGKIVDFIAMDAVKDMEKVSRLECLRLILAHFLLPLEKFGICGILIGFIYWPIVLPFCFFVTICYCTPLLYIIGRFFIRARPSCLKDIEVPDTAKTSQTLSEGTTSFESCLLLENVSPGKAETEHQNHHICLAIAIGFVCTGLNLSVFFLLADVVGYFIKVFLFTLIGAIVNSSIAATYLMLTFWILVYSTTCFNNVYNKYMDLNLKIFDELKEVLEGDITSVTNLRERVQRNTAFKFFDQDQLEKLRNDEILREQDSDIAALGGDPPKYESRKDQLECIDNRLHWRINSLVIFVDNADTPHIPRSLFHEICQVQAPGSPGPVHLSMFEAFKQLAYMVIFIFFVLITVMTFGDTLSTGNQMLLALAGGFLPFVVRFVMAPKQANVDLTSLAFRAKFHHIKLQFNEVWPVFGLPFKPEPTPEGTAAEKGKEEGTPSTSTAPVMHDDPEKALEAGSLDHGDTVEVDLEFDPSRSKEECTEETCAPGELADLTVDLNTGLIHLKKQEEDLVCKAGRYRPRYRSPYQMVAGVADTRV